MLHEPYPQFYDRSGITILNSLLWIFSFLLLAPVPYV